MLTITAIEKQSVCEEMGVKVGDKLSAFCDMTSVDILDYLYYNAQEFFSMTVISENGEELIYDVEKYVDEDLGLTFENNGEIQPKHCQNHCAFCFVDQLPKGLRETLYFKDDDYRLSFISGNYVTLTNVLDCEIDRIVRYHMSPLYISVHVLDCEKRCALTGNRFAGDMYEKLQKLAGGGIELNCQIVMCKGINDGEILQATLEKLFALYPQVKSVAVVPVGLTRFREGLSHLEPIESELAQSTIALCNDFNVAHVCRESENTGFVFCSDEFYLRAGMDIPAASFYGSYPQIENGVGLLAKFRSEFDEAFVLEKARRHTRRMKLITGKSAESFMSGLCEQMSRKFSGLSIEVVGVTNHFFGDSITVAGLVTAVDILEQVTATDVDCVMIPRVMLREFDTVFLDGMSVELIAEKLGCKLVIVEVNGAAFVHTILQEKFEGLEESNS